MRPLSPAGEDARFVDDFVYQSGLQEEIAISGFYCRDPVRKEHEAAASSWLALNPDLPESTREWAQQNLRFYVGPARGGSVIANKKDDLWARLDDYPRVLIAILAKQKEKALPLFLRCIEELDYPKSSTVLYVRTNNNTDRTEQILRDWIARIGPSYAAVDSMPRRSRSRWKHSARTNGIRPGSGYWATYET
ncbi:MAG: hypothetical protein WCB44_20430 [Stellaceae bacterium]